MARAEMYRHSRRTRHGSYDGTYHGGDRGNAYAEDRDAVAPHYPLYDLITALQTVVAPDDDALVVATVVHLLRSGRLTGCGTGSVLRRSARRQEMRRQQRGSPRVTE